MEKMLVPFNKLGQEINIQKIYIMPGYDMCNAITAILRKNVLCFKRILDLRKVLYFIEKEGF